MGETGQSASGGGGAAADIAVGEGVRAEGGWSGPEVCLACGYSLRRLRVEVCPECGDEAVARWEGCRAEREALLGWYRERGAVPMRVFALLGVLFWLVGMSVLIAVRNAALWGVATGAAIAAVVGASYGVGVAVCRLYPTWDRGVAWACWLQCLWALYFAWVAGLVAVFVLSGHDERGAVVTIVISAGGAALLWLGIWRSQLWAAGVRSGARQTAGAVAGVLVVLGVTTVGLMGVAGLVAMAAWLGSGWGGL